MKYLIITLFSGLILLSILSRVDHKKETKFHHEIAQENFEFKKTFIGKRIVRINEENDFIELEDGSRILARGRKGAYFTFQKEKNYSEVK